MPLPITKIPLKVRFLLVGAFNTGVSYILFVGFLLLLGEQAYQQALALAWFLSSFISFFLQKTFVFQSKGNWIEEYIKCLLSWAIAYAINALILETFVVKVALNPLLAQLFSICITTVLTYFLFKKFAFRK